MQSLMMQHSAHIRNITLQVFVTDPKRVEAVVSGLFDSGSVLNSSPDIQDVHADMQRLGVSVLGSHGPAALLMNLVRLAYLTR